MAIVDSSADFTGTGSLAAISGVIRGGGLAVPGSSTLDITSGVVKLSSARFEGVGSLTHNPFTDSTASFEGSSGLAVLSVVARHTSAHFYASSSLTLADPLALSGTSAFTVFSVVERAAPPLSAEVPPVPTFKWMQLLQKCDLRIKVMNGKNPISPYAIAYRLIYVRPDGSRQNVGPQVKTPAPIGHGEYYVTGLAGQGGQPGNWIVQWSYKKSNTSPVQRTEAPFRVEDAVLAANPSDLTDRKTKYGWS